MGTHPIFESDFDCLTDFQTSFVLRLKTCVTSLLIFLLNSAEMIPHQLMTSKPSSQASVLMLMKKDWARLCPNSPVKLLMTFLLKDAKNLLPFHLVVVPLQLLLPVVPLRKHPRKKKRNQNLPKTPETTTWDSAFSTKKWKTRTHTEQRSSWILNCTIIYLCPSVQSIRKKHSEK